MMDSAESKPTLSFFQILIIILSVYVLVALIVDLLVSLPPEVSTLLNHIDNIICLVFLGDFFTSLYKAEKKLDYLKWGWVDLISSIPTIEILRPGRVLRLFRLLRVLRAFRSAKVLSSYVLRNKRQSIVGTVSILAVLLLIFSSISILTVEKLPESNIITANDALWWSFQTMITAGFSDLSPATTEGRFIASVLRLSGLALLATYTGYVASILLESHRDREK